MAAIHISEAEAVRDFAGVLARVRAGAEVVIDAGADPIAVLTPATPAAGRPIADSIALARAFDSDTPHAPMDTAFASDLEDIIRTRAPRKTTAWD